MSLDSYIRAWQAYETLGNLLRDLRVNEALEISVSPTQLIEFLGVMFDLINMIIYLPSDKVTDILQELNKWARKKTMTKNALQKIVGKLQFIVSCIHIGRIFVN